MTMHIAWKWSGVRRLVGAAGLLLAVAGCSAGDRSSIDSATSGAPEGATAPSDSADDDRPIGIMEGYPTNVIAAMRMETQRIAARASARPTPTVAKGAQQVIQMARIWSPADTITVAFRGGSEDVRQAIAEAATEWSHASGLGLDFWTDATRAHFREWRADDLVYAAHVRIGFDGGRDGGYWSAIAGESINPALFPAGRQSLNLEGFDVQLPFDWRATTLHEFGHVLGFEHEHKHPSGVCDAEFRWDDDPGYQPTRDAAGRFLPDAAGRRPGVRTVLGGYPNNWSAADIDFNLRRLPFSASLRVTAFDSASIMKYYFEPALLRRGRMSPCYSRRSTQLSPADKEAAYRLYAAGGLGGSAANAPSLAATLRRTLDSAGVTARAQAALVRDFEALRRSQARISAKIPE